MPNEPKASNKGIRYTQGSWLLESVEQTVADQFYNDTNFEEKGKRGRGLIIFLFPNAVISNEERFKN